VILAARAATGGDIGKIAILIRSLATAIRGVGKTREYALEKRAADVRCGCAELLRRCMKVIRLRCVRPAGARATLRQSITCVLRAIDL
jgi:hypothetical protein